MYWLYPCAQVTTKSIYASHIHKLYHIMQFAGKNTLTTILQAVKSETIDVMADLQGLGKNQTSSGTIKGGPKGLFKI